MFKKEKLELMLHIHIFFSQAEHERNVKHTKQQGDNKETKAFQGQKVQLKSKKKNKLDKKKKKMAEKLTAKSAKV